MSKTVFKPITLDDLPRAAEFDRLVDRPRNSTFDPDFYAWQYLDGVRGKRDIGAAMAAWDGDTVVATLMNSDVEFVIEGNRTAPGAWVHEWYASNAHGFVGLELLASVLPQRPILVGAGASQASQITTKRLRPLRVFPLHRLVAVIDPATSARLSFNQADHTRAFLGSMVPPRNPPAISVTENVTEFGDDYTAAWSAMRPGLQLAANKSAAYMSWRYLRHPRFAYRVLRCIGNIGPAYFVWREERIPDGTCVARLCDAIGSMDAIAECVPGLIRTWRAIPQLAFGDFYCSNDAVCAALLDGGFIHALPAPDLDLPRLFSPLAPDCRKTVYFWLSFDPKLNFLPRLELGRTYFTKGDSNQDRPNP